MSTKSTSPNLLTRSNNSVPSATEHEHEHVVLIEMRGRNASSHPIPQYIYHFVNNWYYWAFIVHSKLECRLWTAHVQWFSMVSECLGEGLLSQCHYRLCQMSKLMSFPCWRHNTKALFIIFSIFFRRSNVTLWMDWMMREAANLLKNNTKTTCSVLSKFCEL